MSARITVMVALIALGGALRPSATASAPASGAPAPDVVVHAADLAADALSEFDVWQDEASPGGRLVGVPNQGDELDAPPEEDPNVTFKVRVKGGVPYRCWVRMKVGTPLRKSQANLLYAQISGAVDSTGRETLKPGSDSFLLLRGPAAAGWHWVGGSGDTLAPRVRFRSSREVTVRLQAGMEGVGFDQFVLSPARFLEAPPADSIVTK